MSMLLMPNNYYTKDLPNECRMKKLNTITQIFDSKDAILETMHNNDNLRRQSHSENDHDSTCRATNFTTTIGLSFENSRAVGV